MPAKPKRRAPGARASPLPEPRGRRLGGSTIAAMLAALAAAFHFVYPNIPDADSFYYAALARLYYTRGLFDASFPWMQHAVVRELSSSLWYGFGVFMIPFSLSSDGVVGIKLAGVWLTTAALLALYAVARRHELALPLAWPLFLFFCAPNVQYQLLMTRPQVPSIALGVLLFSLMVRPARAKYLPSPAGRFEGWPILVVSFFLVWLHLNFVWLPIVVALVVTAARLLFERRGPWTMPAAACLGALLGWLARPEPLNAAKLLSVQLVEQLLQKKAALALLVGTENLPLGAGALSTTFLPLTVTYGLVTAAAARRLAKGDEPSTERKVFLLGSLLLSALFFVLAVWSTRRAYNLWAAFTALTAASALGDFVARQRAKAALIVSALLLFLAFHSTAYTLPNLRGVAVPPDRLRAAALWLEQNTRPGEIVFNVRWSDFGPLFFWNRKNYYVGGLDPIFQHAQDARLYWKYHHLALDLSAEFTCAAPLCTPETAEDTYAVLTRDFNAKYVLVSERHNPRLTRFLEEDGRFEKAFAAGPDLVFRLK